MVPDDWQRERSDFRSAFEPGARLGYGRSVVTMAVRPIAEVELPTGELLIGDAGRRTAHRLARRAPPGRYRVEIAFARFEDGSTLDAAVRVVFAAAAPDRWAPGWQSGSGDGDPPTLAAAVARSGVAFFVDASHEAELRELLAQPGDLTPVLGPGQQCCGITGQCYDPAQPVLCSFPPPGTKFPCIDDTQCFQGVEYCYGDTCDAPGGCVNIPGSGSCTGELDPVCGCNGKSYVNAKCAAADGARVAHAGQCP